METCGGARREVSELEQAWELGWNVSVGALKCTVSTCE